jgi:plastocyanin
LTRPTSSDTDSPVRSRCAAPLAALALTLLAVAPAQADQRIVAAPITRYVNPSVTIDPGEQLTFANQDPLLPHNVTARDNSPEGMPLFSSPTIGGGDEVPVFGADALEPGSYAFYCTIHPAQMHGTLTVSGTPVEPDATPPALQARIDSSGLRTLERRKAVLATLTTDEAVTGTATVRAFDMTLARRAVSLGPGATAVPLKLTAKGLRAIRRRSRASLTLTIGAQDEFGNAATASAKRTLRRR